MALHPTRLTRGDLDDQNHEQRISAWKTSCQPGGERVKARPLGGAHHC